MGMLDVLAADDIPDTAVPVACHLIFAYDIPDENEPDTGLGMVRQYCTDPSWWKQWGLLRGALAVHERDTFAERD